MSLLSAITRDKIVSNQLIEGNVSGVLFENFLFETVKGLRSNPENDEKDIVIFLDNAKIHKHPIVLESMKKMRVHVVFNSQYSPWLNPVEQLFLAIKRKLRTHHVKRR